MAATVVGLGLAAATAAPPGPSGGHARTKQKVPKAKLALPLRDVRVIGKPGRRKLVGRPVGRGSVDWLRPQLKRRALSARAVATVWEGVQERRRARARLGSARVRIKRPRVRKGSFRARLRGRPRSLPSSGVLRATLRNHDPRIVSRCTPAPFIRCPDRDFALADLHAADFRGADLRAANLHGAYLHGASFRGADLRGADLRGATLAGADLRGARLRGAHLGDANLHRAKVRSRELRRAHLCRTRHKHGGLKRRDCHRTPPQLQRFAPAQEAKAGLLGAGPDAASRPARTSDRAEPEAASSARAVPRRAPSRPQVRGSSDCPLPPTQDSDSDGLFDCREAEGWTVTVTTPGDLGGSGSGTTKTFTSKVGKADTDGDGVRDGDEFSHNGNPRNPDTDADGVSDEDEFVTYRSNLNHADTDNDSLPPSGGNRSPQLFDGNEVEATPPSNPRNPDTDGDSLTDYYEIVIGGTNPNIANLPQLDLVPVPGQEQVRIDLPYQVTQTTGVESQKATSTQFATGTTTTSGTSHETTNALNQTHQVGESCTVKTRVGTDPGSSLACTEAYTYTNEQQHSTTNGSTWQFQNSIATTRENQELEQLSAQRQVTFTQAGCLQVILRLRNTGSVSVTVGDFQVLATVPHPQKPNSSRLLATLDPVSGQVYTSECPATDSNFPSTTIPPGGSEDIGFSQQVPQSTLRDYMANPASINFSLGPISMKGTNLAGQQVDFLGDVATKVAQQTSTLEVDFGDGTVRELRVATGIRYADAQKRAGVTLGEVLGPSLGNFSPKYSGGSPSVITSLTDPQTGETVANASDPRLGNWNVVGNAEGIGDVTRDWKSIVLRPGDHVALAYTKDTDGDALDDGYEEQIGTDPQVKDTDADGLDDRVEDQVGWTVPLARGNQADYAVRPSPLACDADGDDSPDGPGPGNAEYGTCPTGGYGPESTRADTAGNAGLEGTDPGSADTNHDGLLDGRQPYPDVLRAVGVGGRLPIFLRKWGGTGPGGGTFTQAQAIAINHNQPVVDDNGNPQPITSYVIDRLGSGTSDTVQKFTGNPLTGIPTYQDTLELGKPPFDENHNAIMAATGISVARGQVAPNAGAPVIVNYYAKTASSVPYPQFTNNLLAAFGDADGNLHSYPSAGSYGGTVYSPASFQAPILVTGTIGNGFLDTTNDGSVIVAHGFGSSDQSKNVAPSNMGPALPTSFLQNASGYRRYGTQQRPNSTPSKGRLLDPSGIAIDRDRGKMYVADDFTGPSPTKNGWATLTRFDLASGEAEAFYAANDGSLGGVRGVAVDPSGDYVYAVSHDSIVKFSSASLSHLGTFGLPGNGDASLTDPWDVDVDAGHGVWLTDRGSNLIKYFHYPFGPD